MPRYFDWIVSDWYESMDGHPVTLAFESVPDEAARRLIAASVDQALRDPDGAYGVCGPFTFSGRLFRFTVEEVSRLDDLRHWLNRLHRAVPITDAVFHGMRDGLRGEGTPVAAPSGHAPRPVDRDGAPFAADAVFDAELGRLYAARRGAC
jgi:hypothetical protein